MSHLSDMYDRKQITATTLLKEQKQKRAKAESELIDMGNSAYYVLETWKPVLTYERYAWKRLAEHLLGGIHSESVKELANQLNIEI